MKIIDFRTGKSKLLKAKEFIEAIAETEGSLALNTNSYKKPVTKKIHILKPNKKIFMGCWQQNYQANDGDGC
jgi:hypothetical protein